MSLNEEIDTFKRLLNESRFDFCKLVYLIFPFGEPGTELEFMAPRDWQMEELKKISEHLQNPKTRYETYRLIVSSGNGANKTALGAMILIILMYTQQLRARLTANTDPQMKSVVWPEYDIWFRRARYNNYFFEKFGTSIKAKDPKLADTWRIDTITWSEQSPSAISGLHNYGKAVAYGFEEAPGIPAVVWDYANGAFTEQNTIKFFFAFGNSDDPESKFEQNMTSPLWNSRRIDTRELPYIDKKFINDLLLEVGGNEDHDEFRVRVRGLPRKTSKDSIISIETVRAAIGRRVNFDTSTVSMLPAILACDPAWQGGDDTVIWFRQGHYSKMLDKYKLDKAAGMDHMYTYNRLCHWEARFGVDRVFIDQGEGTALYTIAMNAGKTSWELINFSSNPNDTPEPKESEYKNIRAQMYYESAKYLLKGDTVIDAIEPEWLDLIEKQLCWTKGTRHKITNQKLAEPKLEIKSRVGQSPDIADGFVLLLARSVFERLPENSQGLGADHLLTGQQPYMMPEHSVGDLYDDLDNYDD